MMDRPEPSATTITSAALPPSAGPLSLRLRSATRDLHRDAERAGLMAALLRGHVERERYARLLVNLHALYAALEPALEDCGTQPGFAAFGFAALRRAPALAADLASLQVHTPPALAPAMQAYVARLQRLAREQPALLVAHAYVRYLGDLNGGQVLGPKIGRALSIDAGGLRFFDFGPPEASAAAAARFRAALDALPLADADEAQALLDEARWSFAQHVELFDELAA